MRQFITISIDGEGRAAVIAHPKDPDTAHKDAANKTNLLAYRFQTTLGKLVHKPKLVPVPTAPFKPAPVKKP